MDFEARLRQALLRISQNPESSRIRRFGVRRRNLIRFKRHYIAYMIWNEQIVVVAIGHSSKRHFSWYRRPKEYREGI